MRSCIVNTVELKVHEHERIVDWEKFVQGLEVSAIVWLQLCEKLFWKWWAKAQ